MPGLKRAAPALLEPVEATNEVTHWNPRAPEVLADQYQAYDLMRRRCAIAYSEYLQYSVFRHADVMRVLMDPETFSNNVSTRVAVPNGMDPPRHGAYRRIIDGYFSQEAMDRFAPTCRSLCDALVEHLPRSGGFEAMATLALPFAVQAQCAFLGWDPGMQAQLSEWIRKKNDATLSGNPYVNAVVAMEFDQAIRRQLDLRRQPGADQAQDITARLMNETVGNRKLGDDEIASILRNWTVGELATIAASVGIVIHYLAAHPEIQELLRGNPRLIDAANDEILRMRAPLIANRRVVTKPVHLGGVPLKGGDKLTLIWASANRDESVFGNPDEFRLDRDPALNLLYGAGIHACPGAPLARLELRSMVESLLAAGRRLESTGVPPVMAVYPTGGYDYLNVGWLP